MARLLVIEDERALLRVLEYNLKQAGHDVVLADNGTEGLEKAKETRPDAILLDLMLPDIAGTEVMRRLHAIPELRATPVVIVTARSEEVDRIVGFEIGAADYIVKPFSVRELVLRVAAVLRRAATSAVDTRIVAGKLRIDDQAHRVWVDDQEIELTLLEFRLLLAFYQSRGRVLARAALLDGVWGVDVSITSRTVDTHVNRLRDKLGAAADYLETVRGVGYRFVVRDGQEGSNPPPSGREAESEY